MLVGSMAANLKPHQWEGLQFLWESIVLDNNQVKLLPSLFRCGKDPAFPQNAFAVFFFLIDSSYKLLWRVRLVSCRAPSEVHNHFEISRTLLAR